MKHALVVGGSSGLGLEIARRLTADYAVTVTGRGRKRPEGLRFCALSITDRPTLGQDVLELVQELPHIDLLVYTIGSSQIGNITALTAAAMRQTVLEGIVAPALLVCEILLRQGHLESLVVVSSTSGSTPRKLEPIYSASKGGLEMLANSLALDERISHTLVVAPGGMDTEFWEGTSQDTTGFLAAAHVADLTLEHLPQTGSYRHIRIPRDTGEAEVVANR
jgi:NAD(P)-dependent dehydrogenase (short-subunit alcohol dehydrogenase family)